MLYCKKRKERDFFVYTVTINDMDLKQIADSGQCFRFKNLENDKWGIKALNKYVEISQQNTSFTFSCDKEEFLEVWSSYFDLATDYAAIKESVDRQDTYLTAAMEYGAGIRLLNQDLWEILVSFIISQNNNIPRIKKSIELLCEKFDPDGQFPQAPILAEAGEEGLKELGLGYRDKYIAALAKVVCDGSFNLDDLKSMDYDGAHESLMKQFGIGKKVADCVCLFGLHHIDAFPVDTHIKKILNEHYPYGFCYEKYKGYLGIIQQYLFFYDLKRI